jgi:hypothetical protein
LKKHLNILQEVIQKKDEIKKIEEKKEQFKKEELKKICNYFLSKLSTLFLRNNTNIF